MVALVMSLMMIGKMKLVMGMDDNERYERLLDAGLNPDKYMF